MCRGNKSERKRFQRNADPAPRTHVRITLKRALPLEWEYDFLDVEDTLPRKYPRPVGRLF
jgi:hypothetical protein